MIEHHPQSKCADLYAVLVGLAICLLSPLANAGWPCSISHAYPQVRSINIVEGQIAITLGEYFSSDVETLVVLMQSGTGGWVRIRDDAPIVNTQASSCGDSMNPPIDENWLLNRTDFARSRDYFEQEIGACTTDGRALWAGSSFYGGDGYWGVGTLIRKDLNSGRYNYVHDLNLQPYSTSHLEFFAKQLWIGTTHHGECGGLENGYGIMRFDLRTQYTVRPVPEICGFAVRGMLVHEKQLWIATDLGLSVGKENSDGQVDWRNYLPDLDDKKLMRSMTCDALYEELLRSSRLATDTAFDMGYGFEDFWQRLQKLRPEFARSYFRKLHGHPKWEWPEY